MTAEQAKGFMPIIQAMAEGEQIEFYNEAAKAWQPVKSINTDAAPDRYRVRPEPVVCYAAVGKRSVFGYFSTLEDAAQRLVRAKCTDGRILKLVEAFEVKTDAVAQ